MTDGVRPWISGHRSSVWRCAKTRRALAVTVSFVTLCSVFGLVFVGFLQNDTLASNGGSGGSIKANVAAPDPSAMALAPLPAIAPSTAAPGKPYGASVNSALGGRQLASLSTPLNLGALLNSPLGPAVTPAAHSTTPAGTTVTPATTTVGGNAPPPTATKPVTTTTAPTVAPPPATTTTTTKPPPTTTSTTTTQPPPTTTTTTATPTTQGPSTTATTVPTTPTTATTVITIPIAPVQQLVTSLDIVPAL